MLTRSEFLKLLESFPGKAELARATSVEALRKEFAYVNFEKIAKQVNLKSFKLNLPDDENVWYKFMSFLVLATENEVEVYGQESLLHTSEKVAERIIDKFNEKFHMGQNIICGFCGIELNELIEFAKSGEEILFL